MAFTPLTAAPQKQVLDSIERLFRYGYSTVLTNTTDWTTGKCPAGHWILQENTTFHRSDDPDIEVRPALIIGAVDGCKPVYDNSRELWDIPVFVEIRYSRNYEPAEAMTLMQQLEGTITHGLNHTTFVPAKTILSTAPGAAQGLNVIHVHEVTSTHFKTDDKGSAMVLLIEFTVRCSGMAATS